MLKSQNNYSGDPRMDLSQLKTFLPAEPAHRTAQGERTYTQSLIELVWQRPVVPECDRTVRQTDIISREPLVHLQRSRRVDMIIYQSF